MIAKAIFDAIHERWPRLSLSGKFRDENRWALLEGSTPTLATETIEIRYPLNPINRTGLPVDESLWIATVAIDGEKIKLSIVQNKYCYENVLSDPNSLDELYTILATHIQDVHDFIPSVRHYPQKPNEPTELELYADKQRAASSLPTRLRAMTWGE